MAECFRYVRSISNIDDYTLENFDRLCQAGYSDRTMEEDTQGHRPLQTSVSLYRVRADQQGGNITLSPELAAEISVQHAVTAAMGKPNTHLLDVTDHIKGRACTQQNTESPFQALSQAHYSLTFTDEADLKAFLTDICQAGPLCHAVDSDETDAYLKAQTASLSPEWEAAKIHLTPKFTELTAKGRHRNFLFWTRGGLLQKP